VVVSAISSNDVSDDEAMFAMMATLEDVKIGKVFGDGAYDTMDCRQFIYDMGGKQIIPPKRTAKQQRKNPLPALKERDDAIQRIKEFGEEGRAKWKEEIGYHQRSLVETHMFRHKTILGDRLTARKRATQTTEVAIKCDVLNRMTGLGMPDSYKIAV
jgi:hypothetical protein